jgi:hypothetical protein
MAMFGALGERFGQAVSVAMFRKVMETPHGVFPEQNLGL